MDGLIGLLVGSGITILIFRIERRDKFRLAAIDKKLDVAQQAYTLWLQMYQNLHSQSEKRIKAFHVAYEFWTTNCLYLTPKARKAFSECVTSVNTYDIYLQSYHNAPADSKETKKKELEHVFNQIIETGDIISESVGFESINKPLLQNITPFGIKNN